MKICSIKKGTLRLLNCAELRGFEFSMHTIFDYSQHGSTQFCKLIIIGTFLQLTIIVAIDSFTITDAFPINANYVPNKKSNLNELCIFRLIVMFKNIYFMSLWKLVKKDFENHSLIDFR